MKKLLLLSAIVLITLTSTAQHIEVLQQGKAVSFRGLSVVDDHVAWASGSKGTIATTNDGGKTWDWKQVKGYEKSDFRDIEAFSSKEAIIMSSGSPALILKTTDGGETWQEKYRNADTAYFFDAMDFGNPKHGLVLGDPIKGKFVLMETNDGGETWHPFKNPPNALPGEAAFAASGTCLRAFEKSFSIVTGGTQSRFLMLGYNDKYWTSLNLPIKHNKASQGVFSYATADTLTVVVGGDYANDKSIDSAACSFELCCDPFFLKLTKLSGFQSCVEYIIANTFLSTGTPGSNYTTDGGKTWRKIDDASYNVCRKAKRGNLVLLAGDHGRIGIFYVK
jgi:photosystem II stability/assembly factor-like uncharacterized protein